MEIIKGSSARFLATVYSNWTGNVVTSTLANLTGGTIRGYIKQRDSDPDSAALLTIVGSLVDPINGTCAVDVTAAQTNGLNYANVVLEIVAKLADGSYIRTGVLPLKLLPNVGKTLF